jgi:hypothetical protein
VHLLFQQIFDTNYQSATKQWLISHWLINKLKFAYDSLGRAFLSLELAFFPLIIAHFFRFHICFIVFSMKQD